MSNLGILWGPMWVQKADFGAPPGPIMKGIRGPKGIQKADLEPGPIIKGVSSPKSRFWSPHTGSKVRSKSRFGIPQGQLERVRGPIVKGGRGVQNEFKRSLGMFLNTIVESLTEIGHVDVQVFSIQKETRGFDFLSYFGVPQNGSIPRR